MHRRRVIFSATVIFILSFVYLFAQEPEDEVKKTDNQYSNVKKNKEKVRIEDLSTELYLTPEQRERILSIVEETRAEVKEIVKNSDDLVKEALNKSWAEIFKLLSEEQRSDLDNINKEREVIIDVADAWETEKSQDSEISD